MIHLVRDPRDRYVSIVNRYDRESKGIGSTTGRWLNSVRAAESNRRRYGDRYLVVRYEDLAHDPVAITRTTCKFLDEDFEPEMMSMNGAPEHHHGNSSFGDLAPRSISTKPIGRFRTALSEQDIAFIQLVAGRAMRRHNYDIEPVDLQGSQRLTFALRSAPLDIGRMVAWTVRERLERSRATAPSRRLAESQP